MRSHGHTDYDGCIDDSQNEIAVLKRFVPIFWVTVQEKTNVINPRQIQRDLIEVIVVGHCLRGRAVEGDIDSRGVIVQGGDRVCIGWLLDIGIVGVKGKEVGIEESECVALGVVDDEQVAVSAIGCTIVGGVVIDIVQLAIRVDSQLIWIVQHVGVPDG